MPKNVYKVVLMIVDHNHVGPEVITNQLTDCNKFSNRCINPTVVEISSAAVEWNDDHPLNRHDPAIHGPAFRELFPLPEVTIGYERGDDNGEPTVTVVPEGTVSIKLVDDGAEARLVLTRNGISVYYCDNDCSLSSNWVSTVPYTSSEADDAFDLRDLDMSDVSEDVLDKYAAELGAQGDDEHIVALAYYIDHGRITEDGLIS